MTQIEIIDDSPTKHRICFKAPLSFRGKLTKMYEAEKDNLSIIDKYISDFNKSNGDIITEYNYEVIDEKNVNVAVVFKHLFRALDTSRKYTKCKVSVHSENEVVVTFDTNIDVRLKSQGSCDPVPLVSVRASYQVVGDEIHNIVEFETTDDVNSYKCYSMLLTMAREGIINVVEEIERINL